MASLFTEFFKRNSSAPQNKWVEVTANNAFYYNMARYFRYITGNGKLKTFSNTDAYIFALSFTEIFNPIDIIAERVSGVEFKLHDLNGKEIQKIPTNVARLLRRPNNLQNFSQFLYNIQFNQLATGGSMVYRYVPDSLTRKTENITSLNVLKPCDVTLSSATRVNTNPFANEKITDILNQITISRGVAFRPEKEDVIFTTITDFNFHDLEFESPLKASECNINNLVAVYQARYNAYAKNGSAGILARKSAMDADMQQFLPDQRAEMLKELQSTDGLIGDKNFIGISSIPMEFIKTLGTIKELEPFAETEADALAIGGGVYGVPRALLPTKESTTFANQKESEIALWQNTIKPYAYDMADLLNELFMIDTSKMEFKPSFDNVEVLQANRLEMLQGDKIELENIEKLQQLGIISDYGKNRFI